MTANGLRRVEFRRLDRSACVADWPVTLQSFPTIDRPTVMVVVCWADNSKLPERKGVIGFKIIKRQRVGGKVETTRGAIALQLLN